MRLSPTAIVNIGFAAALLALIIIAAATFQSFSQLRDVNNQRAREYDVHSEIGGVLQQFTDAETGQRGYLITARDSYLDTYKSAKAAIPQSIDRLRNLVSVDPGREQQLTAARALMDGKLAELDQTIKMRREQGLEAALRMVDTDQGKREMDQLRSIFAVMRHEVDQNLARLNAETETCVFRTSTILLLALCVGAATTVMSAILLNREMQRRAAADKKSRDGADQMHRLISSVRDGIFMLDPKGLVVGWNSGAQGITGYAAEEIVGRHFSTFYSEDDVRSSKPSRELEMAAKDGRVEDNGWRVRKDGSRFWANVVVTAIHDDAKTLVGFSKVVRDMTDTMLAEEKLRNSELRFRKLLDAAPDSVIIVNERGIIQIVNSQTLQVFGYSSEELVGKPIEVLLPQRFSSQHVALRNGYIADPQPRPMSALRDLFGLRKDGREIPIEVSLGPLATPQGLLITAAIRDVTQRKLADEALRQSEERLNLAVESAQLGVWEYDFVNDSSIRSPRHDQIMGFSIPQAEWGFERFLKIVIPEDREIARKLMTEAQSTGQLNMQCRIMWPDNSIHWISAQGKVSCDENGKPVRMRGVISDATENRRTAQAIERLNAELQDNIARLKATNKELEAFSYSVSHDLRAPLRHVDGFVDLLKSHAGQTLDAKGQRYLGIISDSARQMGRLIDDLLAFSRMGRTELRRVNFELKMVVETCIEELSTDTVGRKIDWQIGKLPAVYGDPSMLRLAVSNLLDNAVKYSRTRENAVIEIGSNGSAQETVVYVRDNGVGFDPQYTEKLFGVFQRLHRSDQFEGTGIGLANVRRIILRHGGRTWAEGAIDKGATFYFSLPGNREGQS